MRGLLGVPMHGTRTYLGIIMDYPLLILVYLQLALLLAVRS